MNSLSHPVAYTRKFITLNIFLILLYSLAACSLPQSIETPDPEQKVTQAYQTVQAILTQSSALTPQPPTTAPSIKASPTTQTLPVTLSSTPPSTPAGTTPANATTPPPTQSTCDRAAAGSPIDVTIVDDTEMQPGDKFTKTWKLVNAGTCTWTREYHAEWFFGAKLGDTLSLPLSHDVAPGESVEISVDMQAPTKPDSYQSNWKLKGTSGTLFGIGPNGDSPFWVRIVVVESTPSPSASATNTAAITPTASATIMATSETTLTPTSTSTHTLLVSSSVVLAPGDRLDLDSAQTNPAAEEDILYKTENNNHWLAAQNEAVLGVFGTSQPGFAACESATMSSAPIAVESISPGTYLCYKTGQGHYGWLRLVSLSPADFTVNLNILTWAAP